MQFDTDLLEEGVTHPFLRFYEWSSDAITYGYFIKPDSWLRTLPQNIARRPTGGGLIFHENDFSFTLALPLTCSLVNLTAVERYKMINSQVVDAIRVILPDCNLLLQSASIHGVIDELCMANPTHYDILLGSKKVGGAAQRKNKRCMIHQCSLFLTMPSWAKIEGNLIDSDIILPKLKRFTGSLFAQKDDISATFRPLLKASLQQHLQKILGQ